MNNTERYLKTKKKILTLDMAILILLIYVVKRNGFAIETILESPFGIALLIFAFISLINSIQLIGAYGYSRIASQIFDMGITSLEDLASMNRSNVFTIKNKVTTMINKNIIKDVKIQNDRIVIQSHDAHCLVCPRCGSHLLYQNGKVCEFCGETINR